MNDLLLLAILLGGPQHGYALKKLVGTMTGHRAMHNNLVYPLLKRFVAAGWVSRRKAEGQRGQTRAVYSLTAKGKAMLLARLEEFTEKDRSSGDAFRLRTGLFGFLTSKKRESILAQRETWLAARAHTLAILAETTSMDHWGAETVQFLRTQTEAERKWIQHLRRRAKTRRR
jgi:DNA-binding PadR family transcriptional regulator